MSNIKEEILYALKTQVFKRVWFKVFIGIVILIIAVLIYFVFIASPVKRGEIGNKEVWTDYEKVSTEFNEADFQGVESEKMESNSSLSSEEIETTINLFFFTANQMDQNMFTGAIAPEILETDFFQYDIGERFKKFDEAMKRLSRDGHLEKVKVVRSLPYLEKGVSRIVLDIHYHEIESPIRISILMKQVKETRMNVGEGETFNYSYIYSSVWDLIDDIESQVSGNATN